MARPTSKPTSLERTAGHAGPGAPRVLIAGATGFVGRALTASLGEAGLPPRLLLRDGKQAARFPGCETRVGDVRDAASMQRALDGVDTLVYLVHSMSGPKGGAFEAADREAAKVTRESAERAGVRRILYLSGLGAPNEKLSPHLASRQEVGRILGAGTPELTTLRAAIIVGHGGASFEMMRQLVSRLPVMVVPRWVASRCQPIALRDVIASMHACLAHPETSGGTFDLGGPDILTYHRMMEILGEELGHVPLILQVPVLTPQLSAHWVDLVTDTPPALAHALIEGLRNDVLCEGPTLLHLLPAPPLGFRDAVRLALRGAM